MALVPPHGGELTACQKAAISEDRHFDARLALDAIAQGDLQMFGVGAYSPLRGFMNQQDCAEVTLNMRLRTGLLWPIPVTLPVGAEQAKALRPGNKVELCREASGEVVGSVMVEEIFRRDLAVEMQHVFGTESSEHPGVRAQLARGPWCIAGPVDVFSKDGVEPSLSCQESRDAFDRRGWRQVVGFQTRNPVHRAHEYIIKCALEICDGLFLHPLVGATKDDDIPAAVRLECYHVLLRQALPAARCILSTLPAPMRYAGPREAVLHALVRQNYGCTHFIVGRDHAGVGNFYGTYAAQEIFVHLPPDSMAIKPLFFEHAFFCKRCASAATAKTCPHASEDHIVVSGTQLRRMLTDGERPPAEFTRPEIADILLAWSRS